jgi:glycosyltransferase involved in cell wall biosynthesis
VHLLRALQKHPGITLHVVVATDELAVRRQQGWTKPDISDLNVTIVDNLSWLAVGTRLIRSNPDAIHLFGGLWASRRFFLILLYAICKKRFIGLIVEPYSDTKDGYLDDEGLFSGWLYSKLRPIIYRISGRAFGKRIKLIFAISSKAIHQFRKDGFQAGSVYPFGYFVPTLPQQKDEIEQDADDVLRLVFVGALITRKGINYIKELAALCRKRGVSISIDVYGPGNPESLLNVSPNLNYLGLIPFGQAQKVMKKYDLLFVPSKFDGWGVVVNEALQSGLPILVSKNAGASTLVLTSGAGIVFDPNNLLELIASIEPLIKDRATIADWKEKARTYSVNLTPEIAASYMLECIENNMSRAERPTCSWYLEHEQSALKSKKKVVFFHRKPQASNFSLEIAFQVLRGAMSKDIDCAIAESTYKSVGIIPRIYNIIEAAFRQGDVNHITGDVHFLSYLLRRDRTLLTILDFVFMQNGSWLKKKIMLLLWGIIPEKRVRLISVISQSTKNEVVRYLKCSPDKIRVVPISISPKFIRFDKRFNDKKPKILQIGTAKNKNIVRLARALKNIPCTLEIIGRLDIEQSVALEENNIDYVNFFGLTETEVIARYCESDLVAFVSTYEGFGMPILEANSVGRAVITSNLFSMPEVAGNAACLVDPFNVLEIRNGVLRIINDKPYREILIDNGFVNARRFTAPIVSEEYLKLYREIMSD